MKDKIQSRNKRLNLSDPLPEIDENSLIIGFGRRFCYLQRAILIFRDLERLKKSLTHRADQFIWYLQVKLIQTMGQAKNF